MKNLKDKEVIIIVAYLAKTLGIGFDKPLSWPKILAHMERISGLTTGYSIIIDGETWELLGKKLLPERQYIVVSTTLVAKDLKRKALLATNLTDAIRLTKKEKIFIMGEEPLLKEAMVAGIVNTIQATIVHAEFETKYFFPQISKGWSTLSTGKSGIDESSGLQIQFMTFKNNNNPFPLGS